MLLARLKLGYTACQKAVIVTLITLATAVYRMVLVCHQAAEAQTAKRMFIAVLPGGAEPEVYLSQVCQLTIHGKK